MRLKKQILNLPCALSDSDILTYSREQSDNTIRIKNLENNKKEYDSSIKAEIERYQGRNFDISNRINVGKELREVECVIRYDFEGKQKYWIRTDTKEIAKQEVISEAEMQEELELQEEPTTTPQTESAQ